MKKFFKNIHLWLSVPFGIIITIICLSGATLVFENEITEACNHDTYYVPQVSDSVIALDKLVETVSATLPDSVEITGVTIFNNPERAYKVNLSKPRHAATYIDQYTGQITGKSERLPFFTTMLKLHRWLLGSAGKGEEISVGKLLVGTATLVFVFILLTGLVLWFIRPKKSFKITANKGWFRFWYDLHLSGGLYATIFLLALALTGLTWSFSWYRTGFYSLCGVEAPAGGRPEGRGEGRPEGRGEGRPEGRGEGRPEGRGEGRPEGRGEGRPEGRGGERGAHLEGKPELQSEWHGKGRSEWKDKGEWKGQQDGTTGASQLQHNDYAAQADSVCEQPAVSTYAFWQQAVDNVVKANPDYQQLTISDGTVALIPAGRISLRASDDYSFDTTNGNITGTTTYDSKDASAKIRGVIYNIHTGAWGGIFTRILTMLAALIGASLPLTGYYFWIKRLRRKNKK